MPRLARRSREHIMRVAVIGATGNVGTEVLSALGRRPEVTSVLGIARRLPETSSQPYAGAEWAAVDIGAATTAQEATEQLVDVLRGADAVIHLAWLIQPNSHRELLRRVNVEGTRHVAQAAVEAGVGTLVVASSVGAYSPSPGREVRDESWPTEGVRTSHYSVDKVAQEEVLDEIAAAHPDLTVTRLRPALIFQGGAGSEIQRYFLGGWMPVQLLRAGRPPLLPLPQGLRIQAVHAEDVAAAYAAAAVRKQPGAFNICADDVLGVQDLARLVGHGRAVQLPVPAVRTALAAGHRAGLVAAPQRRRRADGAARGHGRGPGGRFGADATARQPPGPCPRQPDHRRRGRGTACRDLLADRRRTARSVPLRPPHRCDRGYGAHRPDGGRLRGYPGPSHALLDRRADPCRASLPPAADRRSGCVDCPTGRRSPGSESTRAASRTTAGWSVAPR